jgi:hypothetical protein
MKSNRVWVIGLMATVIARGFAATGGATSEPVPPADSQKPPYLAVWKEPKSMPKGLDEYDSWLNRKDVWPDISPNIFSPPARTWAEIEMPFDPSWKTWIGGVPGRRPILSAPILPKDGSTLAMGATGAFDNHFTTLAKNLIENNLGETVLCFGPVIDGPAAWKVSNQKDAANFAAYWRHIVTAMKAVPGADKLQFDWVVPAWKPQYPLEDAYPGAQYVDYIGYILDEGSYNLHIYPYPPFASESEKLFRQRKAWNEAYFPALQTWGSFAKAHGKPFSIPRWDLTAGHLRSEGFDAAYFIQAMHDYIQDPANNIYFASYMEFYHYSWLSPTNGYTTTCPKSAAMFRQVFALPPVAK